MNVGKRERQHIIKIAKELHYGKPIIEQLQKAKSHEELSQIMASERKRIFDSGKVLNF